MEPDGSDAHRYWKESFVVVNDGGFWYWTVLYDPQRGTYTDLRVNGYA